jgi:hypothetical protein
MCYVYLVLQKATLVLRLSFFNFQMQSREILPFGVELKQTTNIKAHMFCSTTLFLSKTHAFI